MKRFLLIFSSYFLALSVSTASAATIVTAEAGMDALMAQVGTGIDIRFIDSMTIIAPELLVVDTLVVEDDELNALFALGTAASPIVNMFFVDAVNTCGGPSAGLAGCASQPGNNIVVASDLGADQAEVNTHELGHNFGLPHDDVSPMNIMGTGAFGNTLFNDAQRAIILASPLVQTGPGGELFVQIKPILISAVPLPPALLLLLGGLGVLGAAGRGRQALA